MEFETILYDVKDGVLTITLNRPDRLNAFTKFMRNDLIDAVDAAEADDNVRAIVFTGAGRGYCAGADLGRGGDTFNHAKRDESEERYPGRDGGGTLTLRLFECRKPLIAAINGPAVGIGITMTLPMDLRLASTNAKFGFVFTRRAIVPEAASSWFLPRLVGPGQALEWMLSGRVFDAEEALAGGLLRTLHAPEELMPAANALAREFADSTLWLHSALTRPGCATAAHCLTPEKVLRAFSRNDRRASARAPRTTCRSFIPGGRNRSLVRRSVDRQV